MSAWENIAKTDQWYTPKYIFDALGNPRFDMDVAAPKLIPAYINAKDWLWKDSLESEWRGFIWMNPPYLKRNGISEWLDKFVTHGNGICLVPDRTSAPWFQKYAPRMGRILFVAPKIHFERPNGVKGKQPGNGSALMALGSRAVSCLRKASSLGITMCPEYDL